MQQNTIIYRGVPCYSFRQLDEYANAVKGTAFRAFKRLEAELTEGLDYFYLNAEQEREVIEELRRHGLIYRSTWNLVLLTNSGRHHLGLD